MTSITVKAIGTSITAETDGKLTSGMVGVPVNIEYDSAWEGMTKTAVFRVGSFERDRKNIGTTTTVPWEVMRHSGKPLQIGIEGRDENGNVVMPTTWTSCGTILQGANASIPGAPNPDSGEIPSGGSAIIDDSKVSTDTTWSSKNTVDKLCPAFEESGEWATCNPFEGSNLNIETKFRPILPDGFAPSPDNRETIGTWSGGTLYHGSKNIVDLKAVDNVKAITFTGSDGKPRTQYKGFAFSLPTGTYTANCELAVAGTAYIGLIVNTASGEWKGGGNLVWGSVQPAKTVTVDDSDIIYVYNGSSSDTLAHTKTMFKDRLNIMVEAGGTSSPYVPYKGNEVTVDFGQNVYGGTYNWTTGVLSIDVVGEVIDGSLDEGWNYTVADKGHMYFKRQISALSSSVYALRCDCIPVNSGPYYGNATGIRTNGVFVELFFTDYTTEAEYRAFLEEYEPLIVYGLSSPITVQLTPQEFAAISGANVCHSNMGETTVRGSESINSVIERLTNAILALGGNV